ncbi:MAG TPA: ABC transporter permease [Corynebacterium casei]|uniref:ABC transporter permease n=1 Tax=Corynebacterium casei TaxID=160386 RepID=UPI000EE82AE9|nr:ABC transporter permease [Corynebacterium casei]HCJ68235.1 ABC transporter permease [Corynebacterium casei]
MTSTLFKLHRTLWWRTIKKNPTVLVSAGMILVYGLLSVLSMTVQVNSPEALHAPVALGMVAMLILSLAMPANEQHTTQETFRTLPIDNLKPAMALSSLWTSRAMLTILFTIIWAGFGFTQLPVGQGIMFIVGSVMAAATTIIYIDVIAKVGSSRKEILGIVGGIGIIAMIFFAVNISSQDAMNMPLEDIGAIASWTPFAAATGWATGGIVKLLIAIATLSLGAWLWWRDIEVAPVQTKERNKTDLRIPFIPNTPTGIEFARSIRYIFRDTRLLMSVLVLPIVVIVLMVQSVSQGIPEIAYTALVICGLLGGAMAVNDFGYDGPAMWLKMASPVRQYRLILSRHWAHMIIPAAFQVLFAIVLVFLYDDTSTTILVGLVSLGVLMTSAALSLFLSAFNPYPVAPPGTSPWADKSGYSGAAFVAVFALMFLGWIPVAPGAALIIFFGQPVIGVLVALAIPAAIYIGIILVVKKTADDRMPVVYKKVGAWVR